MKVLDKSRRKKLQRKVDAEYGYRSYRDRDVEVRKANCGFGVFARRQFLPGELIIEITGQLIPRESYSGSSFVMELSDEWSMEPTIPAAFLNHSCSPNAELLQITQYTLGLLASCNIEPGTELNFDYQWPALHWIPRCLCGAPVCRGWVVDKNEVKAMKKLAMKKLARKNKAR